MMLRQESYKFKALWGLYRVSLRLVWKPVENLSQKKRNYKKGWVLGPISINNKSVREYEGDSSEGPDVQFSL